MKNRKGFTIVELVIVIAVIAILAAVLIPTFSGIVSKANQSAAQQTAMQAVKAGLLCISTAQLPDGTFILLNTAKEASSKPDYGYTYSGNQLSDPVALYDGNNFNKSLYVTKAGEEKNTILINSDADNFDLIKSMLVVAYGVNANKVTVTESTATIVIGEVDTDGGEDDDITLTVGSSPDMPKNAIVFVKLG